MPDRNEGNKRPPAWLKGSRGASSVLGGITSAAMGMAGSMFDREKGYEMTGPPASGGAPKIPGVRSQPPSAMFRATQGTNQAQGGQSSQIQRMLSALAAGRAAATTGVGGSVMPAFVKDFIKSPAGAGALNATTGMAGMNPAMTGILRSPEVLSGALAAMSGRAPMWFNQVEQPPEVPMDDYYFRHRMPTGFRGGMALPMGPGVLPEDQGGGGNGGNGRGFGSRYRGWGGGGWGGGDQYSRTGIPSWMLGLVNWNI